jgi:hypothetical protein
MSNDTNTINTITLDDLNYFWMSNGAPCFIANNYDICDDICDVIEGFGFQIYYVITDKMTSKTIQAKNDKGLMVPTEVYEYTPAVLKVVNNPTGRAVMDASDPFGNNWCPVQETAEYKMPAIPRVIINKLDEFFRLVDAQHKTESIVILTYDTTKEGSDGWGVLVPEQENTSVHCKYDSPSIAELKPDHVMIVGSVHSHPDMPAYASGTDHADQADFDGIHITYGWQKSVNNGATQYHIELQIGGTAYTLKPEDVFEDYTVHKDPDPEVIAWSSKVKKALPPHTGGPTVPAQGIAQPNTNLSKLQTPARHNYPHTPLGTSAFNRKAFLGALSDIEDDAIIAMELDGHTNPDSDCLMCSFPLTNADLASGFCMTCATPIITSELGHFEILELLHLYCLNQKIDPTVAYYVYCTDDSNNNNNFVINIKPAGQNPLDHGSQANTIDYSEYDYTQQNYTLCCNLPYTMIETCTCPVTVVEENISHFDVAHKDIDIYEPVSSSGNSCYDCVEYYQTTCPSFRQAIVNYMTNDIKVVEPFSVCSVFVNYKNKEEKLEYTNYGGYYD